MSGRIRQLEDALAIAHAAAGAPTRHPLLVEQLMGVKNGRDLLSDDEHHESGEKEEYAEEEEEVLGRSFGMLSISETGEMRFLGRAANESLLMVCRIHSPLSLA